MFQRLGPGGGGNTEGGGNTGNGGNSGGGGNTGGHGGSSGGRPKPSVPPPLVHTITTKFCASQFSSTRHSEPEDFPPQTESLGEKAQLFAMARMLLLILAVVGTMQEILSSSGFPWPTV